MREELDLNRYQLAYRVVLIIFAMHIIGGIGYAQSLVIFHDKWEWVPHEGGGASWERTYNFKEAWRDTWRDYVTWWQTRFLHDTLEGLRIILFASLIAFGILGTAFGIYTVDKYLGCVRKEVSL